MCKYHLQLENRGRNGSKSVRCVHVLRLPPRHPNARTSLHLGQERGVVITIAHVSDKYMGPCPHLVLLSVVPDVMPSRLTFGMQVSGNKFSRFAWFYLF